MNTENKIVRDEPVLSCNVFKIDVGGGQNFAELLVEELFLGDRLSTEQFLPNLPFFYKHGSRKSRSTIS